MSRLYDKILMFSHQKCDFKIILEETNICAPVLLILLNEFGKRD